MVKKPFKECAFSSRYIKYFNRILIKALFYMIYKGEDLDVKAGICHYQKAIIML